jgi:alkylation response protein AidB-like acyl-CoA dehydrogenase
LDLSFSAEEEAFRAEVRAFIAECKPKLPDTAGWPDAETTSREDFLAWHKMLFRKGWVAPHWPKEYGGADWSVTQRYIFGQECAAAEMPGLLPFGLMMLGPVLMAFGSEAQKNRFLPRILSGEDWWCQGYSEPGAGSDLASLRMRAVPEGDHFVVNGQKTWTTLAQFADWIFCLVRTDSNVKPQEGISFLLIDMKSPGVTVKPIILIDGTHEVNEVFFDSVQVPAENLVGELNKGWTYAKYLLVHERNTLASVARQRAALEKLKDLSGVDDTLRRKLAEAEIDLMALEMTELRTLAAETRGGMAGPESSILKIRGTEIQQRLTELAVEAAGWYAFADSHALGANEKVGPDHASDAAGRYFNMRKVSIYGGSNEIQRNIIAKAVLGL